VLEKFAILQNGEKFIILEWRKILPSYSGGKMSFFSGGKSGEKNLPVVIGWYTELIFVKTK